MTIKNIQKLADVHTRLVERFRKKRVEVYKLRLDLLGVDLDWALGSFRGSSLIVKEDTILKTVVIKGEGSSSVVSNFLGHVMNKLKDTNCEVISARIRNLSNDYYICILRDGRVIHDACSGRKRKLERVSRFIK